MKLNKKIINYHIKWNKIINYNYNYNKYKKIKIMNYFGINKSELYFRICIRHTSSDIDYMINYNKDYYANVNQNIINKYEYNVLCSMLTYIHNINLFNCICLVKENKDQLYYGRRKEK